MSEEQKELLGIRKIIASHEVTDGYSPSAIIEYQIRKLLHEMVRSTNRTADWRTFKLHVEWEDDFAPGLHIHANLTQDRVDG